VKWVVVREGCLSRTPLGPVEKGTTPEEASRHALRGSGPGYCASRADSCIVAQLPRHELRKMPLPLAGGKMER